MMKKVRLQGGRLCPATDAMSPVSCLSTLDTRHQQKSQLGHKSSLSIRHMITHGVYTARFHLHLHALWSLE